MGRFFLVLVLCGGFAGAPYRACAQDRDAGLPDSPSAASSTSSGSDSASGDQPSQREVSWRSLPKDFLHDQKDIWLFPVQLAKGRHWLPTLSITGATAGLIVADPHVMPYFRSHAGNLDDVNDVFDSSITIAAVVAVPASLMMAGYAGHDPYAVSTSLLAGEAYADSAVVDLVVKAITRRQRPTDIPPGGNFHNTFFAGGKSPFKGSSFPSGHAAGAFSVATVVATRYHKHRWVPWVMYGFATAVSFSRVTTMAHFPSDVFLGAALGYTITRYEVLRPRVNF
ncbi:MAG TPA: phosphatase PAP2 family protein [Candidatus Angelobacter sp.]|nr:phosphatase PAP2 family protein [Candidatus Angelobacter sp.]